MRLAPDLSFVLLPKSFIWLPLCSGAEAIDNAIKIARSFTGRPNIIAFDVRGRGWVGGYPHD